MAACLEPVDSMAFILFCFPFSTTELCSLPSAVMLPFRSTPNESNLTGYACLKKKEAAFQQHFNSESISTFERWDWTSKGCGQVKSTIIIFNGWTQSYRLLFAQAESLVSHVNEEGCYRGYTNRDRMYFGHLLSLAKQFCFSCFQRLVQEQRLCSTTLFPC